MSQPQNAFDWSLYKRIHDSASIGKVAGIFDELQLPRPVNGSFYIEGREGALIFSNTYGVVVKVEAKKATLSPDIERIDDNPWILRPLASYDAGGCVVEICPGTHTTESYAHASLLSDKLTPTGVDVIDGNILPNTGLLPIKTLKFPDGIPVIIDRLSVGRLAGCTKTAKQILRQALGDMDQPRNPQTVLYQPLRRAFAAAWPKGATAANADSMAKAWDLCRQFREDGKLVSGWNFKSTSPFRIGVMQKRDDAVRAAVQYDRLLLQPKPV